MNGAAGLRPVARRVPHHNREDTMTAEAFEYEAAAVVEASVEHHAPCVPECPVCYPQESED